MKTCPRCGAKLRGMVTDDPHISHQVVEGFECPECGYDSVYDPEEPEESGDDNEEND